MPSVINHAIYKLRKRAEKYDKEQLVKTFVDVGPLFTLLKNPDHQIIYGRRGTGKTHALSYLQGELNANEFISIYIDMRTIGSNGGVYSDYSLSITERATRLLVDTFAVIHDSLLDYVLANDRVFDLSVLGPLLDELTQSISEIVVVGPIEVEETQNSSLSKKQEKSFGLSAKDISISAKASNENNSGQTYKEKTSGLIRHRVHFTTINNVFDRIKKQFRQHEIWILIDEWAEVPLELQPYLADLLRRTLFPIKGVTVKIAAIEKRTKFKLDFENGYIGIETGADISASLNLDEFMVFDNDPEKSKAFFNNLLYNHVNQFLLEEGNGIDSKTFISNTFTQIGAFEELVRASEGIPRDAINILLHSAIKADNDKISIPNIRIAARNWYTTDKEKSVTSKDDARLLLRWIIDEVIGERNSRAFLLSSEVQDEIIEYLFDNRILHMIKQNISSKDKPGERYNVFAIDYGAYVQLINTTEEPKGLFGAETDLAETYVDVPINDYRSIRRAILNLDEYYSKVKKNNKVNRSE